MQYSSSWLGVFIFYWHCFIPGDNSRLFLVCAEGSCSGRHVSSQQASHPLQWTCVRLVWTWLSSIFHKDSHPNHNGVTNLHKPEIKNTLLRVWDRSKLKRGQGRRQLLKSLGQNSPDLRPCSYYLIRKSPSFPHTSALLSSLQTALLGNPNRSNHPRWEAFLARRERI
jgi:hypothetical protein